MSQIEKMKQSTLKQYDMMSYMYYLVKSNMTVENSNINSMLQSMINDRIMKLVAQQLVEEDAALLLSMYPAFKETVQQLYNETSWILCDSCCYEPNSGSVLMRTDLGYQLSANPKLTEQQFYYENAPLLNFVHILMQEYEKIVCGGDFCLKADAKLNTQQILELLQKVLGFHHEKYDKYQNKRSEKTYQISKRR